MGISLEGQKGDRGLPGIAGPPGLCKDGCNRTLTGNETVIIKGVKGEKGMQVDSIDRVRCGV